jgi:hypothetical protein
MKGTSITGADITVNDNSDSSIQIDSVTIEADRKTLFAVNENITTDVVVGNVDITSTREFVEFNVFGNVESTVAVGMSVSDADGEDVWVRGTIEIDAVSVGVYGSTYGYSSGPFGQPGGEDGQWGFVVANTDSNVFLGDVTITASGPGSDSDVTMLLLTGEDSAIDAGGITLSADSDVYFLAINGFDGGGSDSSLATGNISITAGLAAVATDSDGELTGEDVSSDIFFGARELQANDTVEGNQTIALDAQSSGNGKGNVYAIIEDASDLVSLTVSGTNAEIYLQGDIGNSDSASPSVFTLDLKGLDGVFGEDATTYVPLGDEAGNNPTQDSGSYVETWEADFGADSVRVVIGSGDLIYNASSSGIGDGQDWESFGGSSDGESGQSAREVFAFTGREVGEVVIGGFYAGAWGQVNDGNLTDRLDFSQFDWNGAEEGLGLGRLSDLSFNSDDDDVIIDYIGNVNGVSFGSIRLVDMASFEDALGRVQDSVLFA